MSKTDIEALLLINEQIGQYESAPCKKSRDWFAERLAPEFSFMRADGVTFDQAERFLAKIETSEPKKRVTSVESISIFGRRAMVRCVVTMDGKDFDNLRLFVRVEETWRLLSWANEAIVK